MLQEHFARQIAPKNLIGISVTKDKANVHIVIKDNGRGISTEDLNRIWETFFSKTVQHGGLGLGLSICPAFYNKWTEQ